MAMDVPTAVEPPAARIDPLRAMDDAALEPVPAVYIRNAAGVRRQMETHAAPLPMPDGSVAHLAVTRGVTERQNDRQQLEDSERGLRVLLAPLP